MRAKSGCIELMNFRDILLQFEPSVPVQKSSQWESINIAEREA